MIKKLLISIGLAALFIVPLKTVDAVTCTNTFPTSFNNYVSGSCIPSAWSVALEGKIGITGSSVTSSLDYQINHIFTSYGSEIIASSSLPYAYTTTTIQSVLNALSAAGLASYNPSTGVFTVSSSTLLLGSASQHPSTDFLSSSTVLVTSFNTRTGAITLASSDVITALGFTPLSTSTGLTIANLATSSISQFFNDAHYVTSTSGGSSYNVTSANPFITTVTSTSNATLTFSSSSLNLKDASTHPASDFLASSTVVNTPSTTIPTTYVSTFNGSSGVVTYAPSTTIPTNNNQLINGSGFVTSTGITSFARSVTKVVCASNATDTTNCDYKASGTNDQATIQTAINAVASSSGGIVQLSQGTFTFTGSTSTVKILSNNITLQGMGQGATTISSPSTSTPAIQVGTRQTGGGLLTSVGLSGFNVSLAAQSSTVAVIKLDGFGNGSYVENVTTNFGGYGVQLEDADRVLVENVIVNNPYISGEYAVMGLENTWGNVTYLDDTVALNHASTSAWSFEADADQGSPAAFARVTLLNDLLHSNNGVASTTGLLMDVPSRAFTVSNSLFESNTWQIKLDAEQHIQFSENQMANNNAFSATSSVDCVQFNNTGAGGGNPVAAFYDDAFGNCVNAFHSVSGFPTLTFTGSNKNDSNITNMFVGSWSSLNGTDFQFAGDSELNLGFANDRLSNVYSTNVSVQNLTLPSTTFNSFLATNGSGLIIATSTPSSGGGGVATTTPFSAGQLVITSSSNALSTVPYMQFWNLDMGGQVNSTNANFWGSNIDILFGPRILTEPTQVDALMWYVRTQDASSSDKYDIGLYKIASNTSTVGTLVFDSGAQSMTSGGTRQIASSTQGSVILAPGEYVIGITGVSTTLKWGATANQWYLWNAGTGSNSTGGVLSATTTIPQPATPDNSPFPNLSVLMQ